ncbi:MarR family transcriptional regulator [Flexivirga oryzae]|uniref:DNA-binding MarR family transcriptional regulator n=1 Tax=Flexivirga oryzae TaxID=1794944 RepID=A0A839NBV9_9MICO|nr:DNA-binding MarR family transcriptional regulator [Flexivirga oryzae]
MATRPRVTDADYARLLRMRTRLRKFEHWSAAQAAAMGLTASQHQLLLAIRGHGGDEGPTIGEVADYLLVRHNTAVELVNRTQELGLIDRHRDGADHRVVRLSLTDEGRERLNALSADHLEELARLAQVVDELFDTLHT